MIWYGVVKASHWRVLRTVWWIRLNKRKTLVCNMNTFTIECVILFSRTCYKGSLFTPDCLCLETKSWTMEVTQSKKSTHRIHLTRMNVNGRYASIDSVPTSHGRSPRNGRFVCLRIISIWVNLNRIRPMISDCREVNEFSEKVHVDVREFDQIYETYVSCW